MNPLAFALLPWGSLLLQQPHGPQLLPRQRHGVAAGATAGAPHAGHAGTFCGTAAVAMALAGVAVLGTARRADRAARRSQRVRVRAMDDDDVSVEDIIGANDIVAFVMPPCPYCAKAVAALKDAGLQFKEVQAPKGSALRKQLEKMTNSSSVPKVYVKGQFVGGCNDGGLGGVLPLLKNGKLQEMLSS
mmetsp:Transcript_57903/g.147009  ORF Transcript_57903/g.147009 Transcript_57903/m.147009 type:complete len:188 (-) Transcript_57903:101-664(-)|eukprot:CAMPEP_0183426926 /NCGR_PEP_ID=MMETSP0370-20130417/39981_1 /TAXON_ID=268820 /ORGANISM="Peridinium aciculiferum, Strain PAER-2" /LENGTH=187 /DNA_ID=CAMNT_0025611403 /DNA_START=69 /DNA_END=632 /DNA_ORIENTATION=-